MRPEIHFLTDWPSAMSARLAAEYLEVGESQFRKMCDLYPDRLRPFNLVPNGERKWSRATIDSFREWREAVGVEREKVG